MAFPTTITTNGLGTVGCAGPYVSSAGAVYAIMADDNRFNLRCLKATDPTSAFASAGADIVIGSGGDIIQSVAGRQSGAKVYVATKNSNGSDPVDIRYHVFNMTSDSWSTTNAMVKTDMTLASGGVGWRCPIDIAVRGDGAVVIVYNGAPENVATVNYDRVYYARKLSAGAAWSADIAIGTAGVAASFVGGHCILGALDRIHFYFADYTNSDLYLRTLNSAFSLDTLAASFDTSIEDGETSWAQRGTYVTHIGYASQPYYDTFQVLNRVIGTSQDAMVPTIDSNVTGARPVLTAPMKYVAAHAYDGSVPRTYLAFIDTSNDIYTAFLSAGAWSTPLGFQTASASAIYASVYTRGSALVLGMVYHDTDPKYSEMTLSAVAAGGSTSLPNGMLLTGVGM